MSNFKQIKEFIATPVKTAIKVEDEAVKLEEREA